MRYIFTLLVAAKLVAGEPLVFILPSLDKEATTNQHGNRGAFVETKDVDFGRQLYAADIKHRGLLSDKTSKGSHKLDQSKIKHPKKAAFQSAGETGLLDFDNPLEDIFTSKFHTKDVDRRLGKSSKSKSSKTAWNGWHSPDVSSTWNDGKSSKSKSDWHAPNDGKSSNKAKSSESKSSKSKSSKSKSSKSKSSKSKSSAWSGYNTSAGAGGGGSVSASASKSAKGHGYESRSTSIDFSYQIGSYSLWSLDESRDSTLDELVEPSTQVKTTVTASPVSASAVTSSPVSAKPIEPKPREETLVVSELANLDSSNAINTPAVSSANESTAVDEAVGSNRMYYVAGAALFGGLVTFFASVFIKRKIQSDDTHTKLNESTSQDETEDTPRSDGSHSYNIDAIQPSTTSQSDCEWSHPDSWLAFDMQA
eukprot:scaffold16790_cov204-Skeletonema_marinoi.AAC.6